VRCYFLRHGVAADAQQWTGDDDERPLTKEGERRMEREAKTLAALDLDIEAIVTSPLLRAKQTAAIVAAALGLRDRVTEDARLGFGFDESALAAILNERARADTVLLVGHEPSMSATIGALVGAARIVLKKGGLAGIDFPDETCSAGVLVWLVPPKILAL
jgi:phosphohistidine phosphatase